MYGALMAVKIVNLTADKDLNLSEALVRFKCAHSSWRSSDGSSTACHAHLGTMGSHCVELLLIQALVYLRLHDLLNRSAMDYNCSTCPMTRLIKGDIT